MNETEEFARYFGRIASEFAPAYFGATSSVPRADFGAVTHPGKVRPQNEDHYVIVRRSRLRNVLLTNLPREAIPNYQEHAYALAVADGVGGNAFGEVASFLALQVAGELGINEIKWPMKINEEEAKELLQKMKAYGEMIHRAIEQFSIQRTEFEGMATTLTIAYTAGLDAFIGHIGDSRAYLFRNNALSQLTRDHTMTLPVGDVDNAGVPIATIPQFRCVITNVLGAGRETVFVETKHLRLRSGDRLLLCTDGLSDMLSNEDISDCLSKVPDSQAACEILQERALAKGGLDNITVVLGKYEF